MKSWPKWATYLIVGIIILCCLSIPAGLAAYNYVLAKPSNIISKNNQEVVHSTQSDQPTQAATIEALSTSTPQNKTSSYPPTPDTQADPAALETWRTLENANVPESNLRDLAERLLGKKNILETLPAPAIPL